MALKPFCLLAVLICGISLSACGHKGGLKTPSQAERHEQKAQKAALKKQQEQTTNEATSQ